MKVTINVSQTVKQFSYYDLLRVSSFEINDNWIPRMEPE